MFVPHWQKYSDDPFVNASPLKESLESVFKATVSEGSTRHPWKLPLQTLWWKGIYGDGTSRTQPLTRSGFWYTKACTWGCLSDLPSSLVQPLSSLMPNLFQLTAIPPVGSAWLFPHWYPGSMIPSLNIFPSPFAPLPFSRFFPVPHNVRHLKDWGLGIKTWVGNPVWSYWCPCHGIFTRLPT